MLFSYFGEKVSPKKGWILRRVLGKFFEIDDCKCDLGSKPFKCFGAYVILSKYQSLLWALHMYVLDIFIVYVRLAIVE